MTKKAYDFSSLSRMSYSSSIPSHPARAPPLHCSSASCFITTSSSSSSSWSDISTNSSSSGNIQPLGGRPLPHYPPAPRQPAPPTIPAGAAQPPLLKPVKRPADAPKPIP
eukprot:GHVN01087553.1.p2 GENE.GHVN01087553.1~~GHVN01087553.1.p2  ORF type:complete len:110 (-),score=9.18 GHVN01087553.1:582-911(-)